MDPGRLSLLFLVLAEIAYAEAPDGGIEALRVKGGNDQIADALAAALGEAVSLSSPVTAISQDSSGVRVQTGAGEVAADYAVLAVILQYRGRPWDRQGFNGEAFTELPSGDTWVATDAQGGVGDILIAFAAGRLGDATAGIDEPARIQQAVRDVDAVFPGSAGQFSTGASVAWSAEPYSRGCYVAPAPGQAMALAEETWEPEGGIFFVGDHTDRQFPGYMEGAVRSGKRAARQIAER